MNSWELQAQLMLLDPRTHASQGKDDRNDNRPRRDADDG